MLSKGKLSQIKTGFKTIFGDKHGFTDDEIVRMGNEVIFYANKFPFESDDLMSSRFSTIEKLSDSDNILEYLAQVPDEEFSQKRTSTYAKLFEIGKKYVYPSVVVEDAPEIELSHEVEDFQISGKQSSGVFSSDPVMVDFINKVSPSNNTLADVEESESGEKSVEVNSRTNPAESSIEESVLAETINATKTYSKEETQMTEHELTPLQKLAMEAGDTGAGSELNGTNVSEVSKNDKIAAKKIVEASQMDRINYSKNAKVGKVLVTAIAREKRSVAGRVATGTVANPRKALDTFIAKTGCTVEEGVIKFSKLHESQLHDEAVKMYNLLKAAVEAPETTIEPYFGKEGDATPVSIKGIVIVDPQNQEIALPHSKIAPHIIQNAFLYLDVDSKSNAQFQLDAAKPSQGSTPKKSYVIRVANKGELLEDESVLVHVKQITDKVSENRGGFRSALSVATISNKPDSKGNPKKITWRIPLEVEQYEVIVLEQYADLFKSGVGNSVKPISADTEADISNIVDKITNLIALESSKVSTDNIIGPSVLAKINEVKSELVSDEAEVVNATLGVKSNEQEFEG